MNFSEYIANFTGYITKLTFDQRILEVEPLFKCSG